MADDRFPDDLVLDDEFVRAASISEPSARSRARKPGPAARWKARRAEKRRRREMVRNWRSPDHKEPHPVRRALTGLLVVGVAVAAFLAVAQWRPVDSRSPERAQAAPGTGLDEVPPEDPFRGSPAAAYADGAAGIRLPKAKAAAGFTATEVKHRLEMAKGLLGAMNLERDVWRGARPEHLIGLLDPKLEDHRSHVRRAFARPTEKNDPTAYATRFDPKVATVHGDVVKVRGTVTYRAVKAGHLRVHTDHLFVYAVRAPGPGRARLSRVIVRRTLEVGFYEPGRFQVTFGKLVLDSVQSFFAGAECDFQQGWIRPYFGAAADSAQPTGAPVDPYDLNRPPAADEGCRQTTGT